MNAAFTTALMMLIHTIHGTFVGGDLSRTLPVMAPKTIHATPVTADLPYTLPVMVPNKIHATPVGADLSRTPPIYRPAASSRHNTSFASKHWSSLSTEGNT